MDLLSFYGAEESSGSSRMVRCSSRVQYLHAEIMDALLEARLRWILEAMPHELDRERAARNFIIQEIAKGRPNLMAPEGRARVERRARPCLPSISRRCLSLTRWRPCILAWKRTKRRQ